MNRSRLAHLRFACAFVVLAALCQSCAGWSRWPWGWTQRWPGPMEPERNPLPRGDVDLVPEGPEEVLALRHADPVQVRPAGLASGFPLSFYEKSIRLRAGSAIYSAPGGRIELLWPDGGSVVLFGRSTGMIGSPSRGEPTFIFRDVERAMIEPRGQQVFELIGGSQLTASAGPIALERLREQVLRINNQSKTAAQISFRDARVSLDPGQVIDLALLGIGGSPILGTPDLETVQGPGFPVAWRGQLEFESAEQSVRVRALGDNELEALGLKVRLDRGETIEFSGLAGERAP